MPCAPSIVLNSQAKHWCSLALETVLDKNIPCSYTDPETGEKCVNTKVGHSRGHQDSSATWLGDGEFIPGPWTTTQFISLVEGKIEVLLRDINNLDSDYTIRRQAAITSHKGALQSASDECLWRLTDFILNPAVCSLSSNRKQQRINTCFTCLFGKPEYRLPCGHIICEDCLCDFGQREKAYPDTISYLSCILCIRPELTELWPVKIRVRPRTSGTRILSLDGGGVRGIVELEVLRRLETSIGIGLPIWYFFDLIVGTSVGKSRNKPCLHYSIC